MDEGLTALNNKCNIENSTPGYEIIVTTSNSAKG